MDRLLQLKAQIERLLREVRREVPAAPPEAEPEERKRPSAAPEVRTPAPEPDPEPGPSDRLISFETLAPWERRSPAVFEIDPIPVQEERQIEEDPFPVIFWEPDESGNVIVGRDDRLRAEERRVQEIFSRYVGNYESFEPDTEEDMTWESDDDDDEERRSTVASAREQLAFDFDGAQTP